MNNSRLCGNRIVVEEARPKDSAENKILGGKSNILFNIFFAGVLILRKNNKFLFLGNTITNSTHISNNAL